MYNGDDVSSEVKLKSLAPSYIRIYIYIYILYLRALYTVLEISSADTLFIEGILSSIMSRNHVGARRVPLSSGVVGRFTRHPGIPDAPGYSWLREEVGPRSEARRVLACVSRALILRVPVYHMSRVNSRCSAMLSNDMNISNVYKTYRFRGIEKRSLTAGSRGIVK